MTKEELLTLKRVVRNFDHCCWSKEDHLRVLTEIDRLHQELAQQHQLLFHIEERGNSMKFGVYRKVKASGKGKGTGIGELYLFVNLARDHYGKLPNMVTYVPLRIEPEWAGTLRNCYIPREEFEECFEYVDEGLPDDLGPTPAD